MLIPEFRQHASHRSRDVIAVLAVFGDGLDANSARIELHELPHAVRHHADPVLDAAARVIGKRAQQHAHEIRVPEEVDVGGIALDVRGVGGERLGGVAIREATQKGVEQFRLALRRRGAVVLDRIRDAAQQVRGEHRAAEHARQESNGDRERAGDFRQNGRREPLRIAQPLGAVGPLVRSGPVGHHLGGRDGPMNASSSTCAVVAGFASANSSRSSACSSETCARETSWRY